MNRKESSPSRKQDEPTKKVVADDKTVPACNDTGDIVVTSGSFWAKQRIEAKEKCSW